MVARRTANQKVGGSNPHPDEKVRSCLSMSDLLVVVRGSGDPYNPSLWECAKTTGGTCFLCILASLFMISECVPLCERVCPLHPEAQG